MKRYFIIWVSLAAFLLLASCSSNSHHNSNEMYSEADLNDHSLLTVHFIDVGQADATLLNYQGKDESITILIDAGDWNGNEAVEYLKAQNIKEIDLAIGTHPDADHIGQLEKVIKTFPVGEVWLSGNTSSSQTYLNLLKSIQEYDIDYYEPRMGEDFQIGPLELIVLYPETISEKDNRESISLKITFGDVRFIFTGDASKKDELIMLQNGFDVKADILQLGHHGSSTSTHPTFLKEVQPDVAIYSAGTENSYGHPHPEVVELVKQQGIELFGTDTHGTIIIETDGSDFNISTEKDVSNHSMETSLKTGDCLDINIASSEQLQNIVHIGPERAKEIIQLRPFTTIDDLEKISGIGPGRLNDIKTQELACIGG